VDTSTNYSATNKATFTYVVSAKLTLATTGGGSISPNYSNAVLEVGKTYAMTAMPATGFAFQYWGGSVLSNKATLSFVMASNLNFIANFVDTVKPLNVITYPAVGQVFSNGTLTALGKASDNVGVAGVWYQLNNTGWNPAFTGSQFTNWSSTNLTLQAGSNVLQAYAADAALNYSSTNTVRVLYVVPPEWAPDALTGLTVQVVPKSVGSGGPSSVSYGTNTFSEKAASTNDPSGVGTYGYVKTSTNSAHLTLTYLAPPTVTNHQPDVTLLFTNLNQGTYTNASGNGNSGVFSIVSAPNLALSTIGGHTVVASTSSGNVSLTMNANGTFSGTSSGGALAGTYTYVRSSPVGAMLVLNETNNGKVHYIQLVCATASSGTYLITTFNNLGVVLDLITGAYTIH